MRPFMKRLVLVLFLLAATPGRAADTLASLIHRIGESSDPQVQLDILRGLHDAFQGRRRVPMPEGWSSVESRLAASPKPEVRTLSRSLGLTFGSETALTATRAAVTDTNLPAPTRQGALRDLVGVRDPGLPNTLRGLLSDPSMRGPAIRALAAFDDPATAPAVMALYPRLSGTERREALATLASRVSSARTLLGAMESGSVPSKDLTADVARQLRNLNDDTVNQALTRVYGSYREVGTDAQAQIEQYKRLYWAGGSTPGDAIRGRAVFAKICQQCHTLFDVGGKVGPDLTGSNRGDVDYVLQNVLDPNAIIPNEFRASTVEMKDGRVLTGIVKQQDNKSLMLATATETLNLPRADIDQITESQLSMMPEGLLKPLADQEFRDLVYYLGRPGQSPMLATADTVGLFFNGRDLSMWQGDESVWHVEDGQIIGRPTGSAQGPQDLRSDLIVGDFRLVLQALLKPDSAGAGIYFRAEPTVEGQTRGYEIALGAKGWGKLNDTADRGVIADKSQSAPVKAGEWNLLEIVASGNRLRFALNGLPCIEIEDPSGARQGLVAFELAGGPAELRLRDLRLELNPSAAYSTVGK